MADRGNMFCQAFEIQMPHSTLCLSDSFERSHKRTATEMEVPRAEVGEIGSILKIDNCATKKKQTHKSKTTWIK